MAQFSSSFLIFQLKTLKLEQLKGIHLVIMFTVATSLYVSVSSMHFHAITFSKDLMDPLVNVKGKHRNHPL